MRGIAGLLGNVYSAEYLVYSLYAGYYPLAYKRLIPDWEMRFGHHAERKKNAQRELHRSTRVDFFPIPRQYQLRSRKRCQIAETTISVDV
jgi:hypothetical protein